MFNRIGRKQGHDEDAQQPTWKSLLEIHGQALPRHHPDSGAHHLNRGHQGPRQECSPEKLRSKAAHLRQNVWQCRTGHRRQPR